MTQHTTSEQASPDAQSSESPQTASTVAVSVCFWFTLLTATVIYGLVALAPKLAVWQDVRAEYRRNIHQMVTLEEDVAYLERVDEALQTDPEFLERLVGLQQQETDSELIPVSGSLLFGQSDEQTLRAPTVERQSMFIIATRHIATSRPLRRGLLLLSAVLTLFAFAFLNDAGAGFVQTSWQLGRGLIMLPLNRYTVAASTAENVDGRPAAPSAPSAPPRRAERPPQA